MHVQVEPVSGQEAGSTLPPPALPSSHGRNAGLGRAQPVMGQEEGATHPMSAEPVVVAADLSFDGEPVIRRRTSSGSAPVPVSAAEPVEGEGWEPLAVFREIAADIRRENDAGVNKAERALRAMKFGRELTGYLIGRHHDYLRPLRALAGGAKPTPAQHEQAFALCVFDMHRWMCEREVVCSWGSIGPDSAIPGKKRMAVIDVLARGAKQLTSFDGLLPMIELWTTLQMRPHTNEANAMRFTLVNHTGLFEPNARRLLHAYAEALAAPVQTPASSAAGDDVIQRMRASLVRQWMTGPDAQERAVLDRLSCDEAELYHRKLIQQYALLCRCFGQPLPPRAELIMVDRPD